MKKRAIWVLSFMFWGILNLSVAEASENRTLGERKILGGASVWSWVDISSNKALRAIGVTMEGALLESLPHEMIEIEFKIPQRPSTKPYRHVTVDWNPHGHDPTGIYGVPHFDFHFYMIPSQTRKKIICAGADEANCMKMPPASALAPDYVPTPEGVPAMGWHWVDSKSPEFNGQPFTSTMIYGYYKGRMTFIEPMVTLAFLQTKPQFVAPIRQPSLYPEKGYYPTEYQVRYRSVADEFDIILTKMVYRK